MNGFISDGSARSTSTLYRASASCAIALSFFTGVLTGSNFDLVPRGTEWPEKPETISAAPLAWFNHDLLSKIQIAEVVAVPPAAPMPEFKSFELPKDRVLASSKDRRPGVKNLKRLGQVIRSFRPAAPQEQEELEPIQIVWSSALSTKEQDQLKELLLQEQVKTTAKKAPLLAEVSLPAVSARSPKRIFELKESSKVTALPSGTCGLGIEHQFQRAMNGPGVSEDTQICPERLSWLSKTWDQNGWVKLEGAHHRPTLTRARAPNGGSTLLMDDVALAALMIRNGLRITKGMGIVVGALPAGYKVDFVGRSEEAEYFESNHTKYFAVLNAEPGAGVLELVSEQNQGLNTTVFVPVLEDVVTYLDLSAPVTRDLLVRVVKNATEMDPEVTALTVGVSTQNGIQAITGKDGVARLQRVNVVEGFPVFVDVSSKQGQNSGYTYRYELKNKDANGVYVVNQIAEKSLARWLKQVKPGLSDQAAMVVGFYDRNKIDGFKTAYQARVEPLTTKFGLEPLNYSILWDGQISADEPLEGDLPRFMSVQVAEGLSQVKLIREDEEVVRSDLFPVSSRVIHVVSE